MDKQIKAFISSTFEDLKGHRDYVIHALRDAGVYVDPMENWTADSNEPKIFSQERIIGCDICILLVAFRRGYIQEGEKESITQLEYRHSIALGIDMLVFLLDDDAPWPRRFDDMDRDSEIGKWRNELKSKHGVGFFKHEPNSIKIEPAISRWLKNNASQGMRPISIATGIWNIDSVRNSARKASDQYLTKMQNERVYLPHLYARRIDLESHLGGFLDKKCTKNGMLIVGTSGIGKTNTLCNMVKLWRDDPNKLASDVVIFVGGATLPGGNFSFRDVLLDRLEIYDNFKIFLSAFESQYKITNSRFIVIVDGVDKHPQPTELLRQIDNLVVNDDGIPWLKVIISIGEVVYRSICNSGMNISKGKYYTICKKDGLVDREAVEIILGRMTDEELAEAYGKYLTEPGMAPISSYESLTSDVKNAVNNPLFLRIIMEVFDGRKIPRRVLTTDVLLEYCSKKVFNNPNREYFINRFVDYLFSKELISASFDSLAKIPDLQSFVLDSSPKSTYLQLLDEQVLEVQYKRISSILPPHRSIAFTYDRLLEYLMTKLILEQYEITVDTIILLSKKAVKYIPLRGVLTTLLLSKIDEGEYDTTATLLQIGNKDIMKSVAIDLFVELEHIAKANTLTSQEDYYSSPIGKLLEAMLHHRNNWTFSLLLEFGSKIINIGLYWRSQYYFDKLILSLNENIETTLVANIRLKMGEIKNVIGQKSEAIKEYEQALTHFRFLNNRNGEQATLDAIGSVYFDMGELMTAENYFEQSIKIDRELIQLTPSADAYRGEAASLINLSDLYYRNGDTIKAIEFAEKAKETYSAIKDERGLATAIARVGTFQRRLGYYDEARNLYLQAMTIYQQLGDKRGTAQVHCFIGLLHHNVGSWGEAHFQYKEANNIYDEIEEKDGIAYTLLASGESYRWEGKYGEALECYEKSLEIFNGIGKKRNIFACLSNIGATHLFAGNFEKAINYLNESHRMEVEKKGSGGHPETLAFLSAAELGLGHLEKALSISDIAVKIIKEKYFGQEDTLLVYYYRAKILDSLNMRLESDESLELAYKEIIRQSELIKDIEGRKNFIENFPLRRNIVEEWERKKV